MARTWIQGEDQSIVIKLTNSDGDAVDVSLYEKIKACIPLETGHLYKMLLKITGNTHTTDIIDGLSTEDCLDIEEGQPITGPGIPADTTVLKTPHSETGPTAAGSIKLSAATTTTVTGAALVIGDITPSSPTTLGRFTMTYSEDDTESMKVGANSVEVKLVKSGLTKYLQYANEITVVEKIC